MDLRLGTGTVSKIISEWKTGLDYPIAEEIRELVLGLRKLGISASRYAEGARIASVLIKLGVHDEEFHHFVSEIYDRCKKMDLQPDRVADLLRQLLDLSESVPLPKIPEYVELQTGRVQKLRKEIEELDIKELDAKARRDMALNEEATTRDELNQFSSLKQIMSKNGVKMSDNSKFVAAVVGARKLGFDPKVIAEKVSNVEKLEIDQKALGETVEFLEKKKQELELRCSFLDRDELVHRHRLSIYHDLESLGMGIKELKLLIHTVREIAIENNISKDRAGEKFFSDVQEQYDDKLGFEVILQSLKSEIQKNQQIQAQLSAYTAMFNSIIISQFAQIRNMSSSIEFAPLVNAAKGEKVPINELKKAILKAIDVLISSDPTDRSVSILTATKNLLLKDVQVSGDIA